jgi:hypothetical protein
MLKCNLARGAQKPQLPAPRHVADHCRRHRLQASTLAPSWTSAGRLLSNGPLVREDGDRRARWTNKAGPGNCICICFAFDFAAFALSPANNRFLPLPCPCLLHTSSTSTVPWSCLVSHPPRSIAQDAVPERPGMFGAMFLFLTAAQSPKHHTSPPWPASKFLDRPANPIAPTSACSGPLPSPSTA